jgi:hypothetical protein
MEVPTLTFERDVTSSESRAHLATTSGEVVGWTPRPRIGRPTRQLQIQRICCGRQRISLGITQIQVRLLSPKPMPAATPLDAAASHRLPRVLAEGGGAVTAGTSPVSTRSANRICSKPPDIGDPAGEELLIAGGRRPKEPWNVLQRSENCTPPGDIVKIA